MDEAATAPKSAPKTVVSDRTESDAEPTASRELPPAVFDVKNMSFFYGDFKALNDINLSVCRGQVTAFIGPSGCGKTTFLRCLNRMNDLVPNTRVDGKILFREVDINGAGVKPVELRRKIGMVFQKPNPFPKSIYENIAFTPRANGVPRSELGDLVEQSLRAAALWDEVKDKLKQSAFALSGGQQQRLCIARTVAVKPDVILMDEPCAALDPIATVRIEELMTELKKQYTIAIVTHNMQQAARVSDRTAFFSTEEHRTGGYLVEIDHTDKIFTNPSESATEDYITGRFG